MYYPLKGYLFTPSNVLSLTMPHKFEIYLLPISSIMLAVFPNTRFSLDLRCHRFVNQRDIQAASDRIGNMALKDISGIGELAKLAKLALLCFCLKYRKANCVKMRSCQRFSNATI